jgi:hypothetical protein
MIYACVLRMSLSARTTKLRSPSIKIRTPNDKIARRRTFAIISHPDAGKTTLTEKLLLFGGAIQLAGEVSAHGERRRVRSVGLNGGRARARLFGLLDGDGVSSLRGSPSTCSTRRATKISPHSDFSGTPIDSG